MKIDPDKVPTTMREAVDMVIAGLSEEEKTLLRSPDYNSAMLHFTIGTFMRNAWSLWVDTPLRRDCIQRWKIAFADDLSGLLFAWVQAEVRGLPFDPDHHCQRYHAHWKQAGTTSLKQAGIK